MNERHYSIPPHNRIVVPLPWLGGGSYPTPGEISLAHNGVHPKSR
ncbi:MAG: ATP-binding protein [Muribaculaceae bacterium]|nr:ATP-binding protein [Muribaculaceae bacterium]